MMVSSFVPPPESHDLSLPEWGPYSKRFFGISHLADRVRGSRFDFTVVPGIYRRQFGVPDALRPSGYLPWEAAPDLEYYSYRQQLEWKDRLYCDISFGPLPGGARLVRCACVNRTEAAVDFALHLISKLEVAPVAAADPPACRCWLNQAQLADGRGLEGDAMHPGEVRTDGAVGGSAIRLEAGAAARFQVPEAVRDGRAWLRFRPETETAWRWTEVTWDRGGTVLLRFDETRLLDGVAVTDGDAPEIRMPERETRPEFRVAPGARRLTLRYAAAPETAYALRWSMDESFVRHYAAEDFNHTLLYDDHMHQQFLGGAELWGGHDHALDVVLQPIPVPADAMVVVHAAVAAGRDGTEAARRLEAYPDDPEAVERENRKRLVPFPQTEFTFSQRRMAAVTLSNVVWPTYLRDRYIRHHSPGRRWNCLYTWDSGFIGLGMLEFDRTRAVENLNAYLTGPGDRENAFVLHGSPVPVQLYLLFELWNRTRDRAMLAWFYPRAKQYYDYLAGHDPRSLTRSHGRTSLICTWDYFYNSGGWDDYPPQWFVRTNRLTANVIPAVGTSHLIRCARMLALLAGELGEETAGYRADIAEWTADLQRWSWDDEAGVFSYVTHDADGNPNGFLRDAGGVNFNRGLDGATPLLAGAATPGQRERLWAMLASPEHCWTPVGLSTVDQAAPYFRRDGYWNGSVWMPHQWFFWKAALNDGRADFAWRIAETALTIWEKEVRASYACYEQFSISSGRGSGWHHFSALSAPVLCWFGAYCAPGRLTVGNDVLIRRLERDARGLRAELTVDGVPGEVTTVIANVEAVAARYAGRPVALRRRRTGSVEVDLPKGGAGLLELDC